MGLLKTAIAGTDSEPALGGLVARSLVPRWSGVRPGYWCVWIRTSQLVERRRFGLVRRRSLAVPSAVYTCRACRVPQVLDDHAISPDGTVHQLVVCAECGNEVALRLDRWDDPCGTAAQIGEL